MYNELCRLAASQKLPWESFIKKIKAAMSKTQKQTADDSHDTWFDNPEHMAYLDEAIAEAENDDAPQIVFNGKRDIEQFFASVENSLQKQQ